MKKVFLSVLLVVVVQICLRAQVAPPFWSEIKAFKKQDSTRAVPPQGILLIGSSSFTLWKDVGDVFSEYPMVNRGFGGSTLIDVIRYAYDVIIPYQPRQVIIYCGENDIAYADSISAGEVLKRVQTLFGMIRTNLPSASISYVSIKPSPSRAKIQPTVVAANKMIKAFIARQKNADFIDVYQPMLDAGGQMREELYLEDRLHMRPEGYAIWARIMKPYLVKK